MCKWLCFPARFSLAERLIWVSAVVTLCLGAAHALTYVWVINVQISSAAVEGACFDLACLLSLSAIGTIAASLHHYRCSRLIGGALFIAGNVYFSSYLAGFNLSLGRLMFPAARQHLLGAQIAPPVSIVFVLIGCALTLISRDMTELLLGAVASIGSVVASIGLVTLFGYQDQLFKTGDPTHCSHALTSVGDITLGMSLFAFLWARRPHRALERSKRLAAFVVIKLVLICGAINVAVFVNTSVDRDAGEQTRVSYETIRAIDRVTAALADAEAGERGYLITHDPNFLALYEQGASEYEVRVTNPALQGFGQLRKSHDLRNLLALRMGQLSLAIRCERAGQHKKAVAMVSAEQWQGTGAAIQTEVHSVVDVLQRQILAYAAERELSVARIQQIVVASYAIAVCLMGCGFYLVWTEANRRSALERRIRLNETAVQIVLKNKAAHAADWLEARAQSGNRLLS